MPRVYNLRSVDGEIRTLSSELRDDEKQIRANEAEITVMVRFTITVTETEIYESRDNV